MTDYEKKAPAYARHRQANTAVVERLIAGGSMTTDSRVLEIGCGTGNYITALVKRTACQGWGVDPSPAMLSTARQRLAPGRFLVGHAERLALPGVSFDLVFSVDVIHHVDDRPATFREAYRVCRPGGIICTVTDSEAIIRRRQPLANYFPATIGVDLARYPRIQDLRKIMATQGFQKIREEEVGFSFTLADSARFRDKAYSSLQLIPEEAFHRGLSRLEQDLASGPISCTSAYLLLWGQK